MKKKVTVGLSGGVDSACAALLLLEQSYEVEALFMFNWNESDDDYCSAAEDFKSAQVVAEHLGIPLQSCDFSHSFSERVFKYLVDEYAAGRTPNPDILCNRYIKFGEFQDYAFRLGADFIATGHYASVQHNGGQAELLRAADENKDQTYFLAGVRADSLSNVLFPLGGYTKEQIRQLAAENGLPNHARKDSTGVCFVGERPFQQFLKGYLPAQPGPIMTAEGKIIGQHDGVMFFTVGQRKGLNIGGVAGALDAPWYVIERRMKDRCLVVSQDENDPALYSHHVTTDTVNWLVPPTSGVFECQARIRHRQPLQSVKVVVNEDKLDLTFDEAQRAAADGQFVVLYQDQRCLGSAAIKHIGRHQ